MVKQLNLSLNLRQRALSLQMTQCEVKFLATIKLLTLYFIILYVNFEYY